MLLKMKTKEETKNVELAGIQILIEPKLAEVYQNSVEIKNKIMEKKDTYEASGCRFTGIYRCIKHRLEVSGKVSSFMSIVEMDRISDEGGLYGDAWADGYYADGTEITEIIHVPNLLIKINKLYKSNLSWELLDKANYTVATRERIKQYIQNNIPMVIKMPSLVTPFSHFVNVDSMFVTPDGELFIRIKETFSGYNGYDRCWVKWDYPGKYEIIL